MVGETKEKGQKKGGKDRGGQGKVSGMMTLTGWTD